MELADTLTLTHPDGRTATVEIFRRRDGRYAAFEKGSPTTADSILDEPADDLDEARRALESDGWQIVEG